jgi:hypothetical protein
MENVNSSKSNLKLNVKIGCIKTKIPKIGRIDARGAF